MILSATRYMQFVQEFARNIRNRTIEGTWLSEFTVAKIFSKVLPEYPKLQRLDSTRVAQQQNQVVDSTPIIEQRPLVIPPTYRTVAMFKFVGESRFVYCYCYYYWYYYERRAAATTWKERPALLWLLLYLHEKITSLGHGIAESALYCTTEMLLALGTCVPSRVLLRIRTSYITCSLNCIRLFRCCCCCCWCIAADVLLMCCYCCRYDCTATSTDNFSLAKTDYCIVRSEQWRESQSCCRNHALFDRYHRTLDLAGRSVVLERANI